MNPDLEFSHMSDNISCFFFEGGHFLTNCKIVLITKTWARSGPEVGQKWARSGPLGEGESSLHSAM